jgi:pyruvate/2-oxoacid:ferredoxin oxidoreductase alpha subunit
MKVDVTRGSYYDSIEAFNFAERFKTPVIHMLDKAIANSIITCRIFLQTLLHQKSLMTTHSVITNENHYENAKKHKDRTFDTEFLVGVQHI